MNKLIVIISIALSSFAFAQVGARISFNTGDNEIESHLNDVNVYASADISLFRKDLTLSFHASNYDMDRYLVKERIQPADIYYGYVISFTTGRSFPLVMKMYKEKKGWGSVAKELGIKPGSDQFHALKNNTLKSIRQEKMKVKKSDSNTNKNKGSSGDKKKNNSKKNK